MPLILPASDLLPSSGSAQSSRRQKPSHLCSWSWIYQTVRRSLCEQLKLNSGSCGTKLLWDGKEPGWRAFFISVISQLLNSKDGFSPVKFIPSSVTLTEHFVLDFARPIFNTTGIIPTKTQPRSWYCFHTQGNETLTRKSVVTVIYHAGLKWNMRPEHQNWTERVWHNP